MWVDVLLNMNEGKAAPCMSVGQPSTVIVWKYCHFVVLLLLQPNQCKLFCTVVGRAY